MPTPRDSDERHEAAQRDVAALALGEAVEPANLAHVTACATCQADIDAYRQLAELARAGRPAADGAEQPPAHIWTRIVEELGKHPAEDTAPPLPHPVDHQPRTAYRTTAPRRRAWRRVFVGAAAVIALAGAGAGGWALGHSGSRSGAHRAASARLAAQPGTPASADGTAAMHRSAVGFTLTVTARGLPATAGYYEVWLFSPSVGQMVAVGSLGDGGRGSFTVPAGLDLGSYRVVDVSAQQFDGNNRHERSVLRGPLAS